MSNANNAKLRWVEESTYGTTPSGTYQELRYTSDGLSQTTSTTKSGEIRPDRQISDVVRTSIAAGGDVGFELSYGTHDEWFKYALMSSNWAGTASVSGTNISASSADNSFNSGSSGFGSLTQYSWVYVTGFATAANNGFFRILTQTTAKITIDGTLVTEAAGPSVTIKQGDKITNGTTLKSISIEREYTDLTNIFEVLSGHSIEGFSLGVSPENIVSGSFSFMGKKAVSGAATASSSTTSATTTSVMNAIDHVSAVVEGGVRLGSVADFKLNVKNNLRSRLEVGVLGAASLGTGEFEVDGDLEVYFADHTLYNKYLNFTTSRLALCMLDGNSKGYVFEIASVKYEDGARNTPGPNQDIMAKLKFKAFRDSTMGVTMRIFRFP